MWLLAVERGEQVEAVFADTGHEHPLTYEYLDYLERSVGPIRRVKADFTQQIAHKREVVQTKWREEGIDEERIQRALAVLQPTGNPYLDLCLWKGRFPSAKARFCTAELKILPIEQQVFAPVLDAGEDVVSWQAVRREESRARAQLDEREEVYEYGYAYQVYRPLLDWTVSEVFAMHAKHGVKPNPLYNQGMGRVGCMPCIMSRKEELYQIAARYPQEVARVAQWERLVSQASKRGASTFFATADGHGSGIEAVADWAKTGTGGQQFDLFRQGDVPVCSSIYGLCE